MIRNLIKKMQSSVKETARYRSKYSLYIQLLFTAFAFFLMVVLSYNYTSKIMRSNLLDDVEDVFDLVALEIEFELQEPQTMLHDYAQTVRSMILRGATADNIQDYTSDLYASIQSKGKNKVNSNGLYAYIEKFSGGPVVIGGFNWVEPEGFSTTDEPWYQAALAAGGEIAEIAPYTDVITGETVVTYSCGIYDDNGDYMGVVGIDIEMEYIDNELLSSPLTQYGYGMLIDQDLTVIVHSNPDFVGLKISDPKIPAWIYADEMVEKGEISEAPVVNWKGEKGLAFFRRLSNGWYLSLFTLEEDYYRTLTQMGWALTLLGIALAIPLIIILIRVDAVKTKLDIESQRKSAFLSNMSHEIRTPMNAIIGMTFLGKSTADTEYKNQCFQKIEDAGHHLLSVINDILDMSKIEAGKFEILSEEFIFEKMLRQIENVVSFRMEEKRQRFTVHVDDTIPKVLIGDDQRLAQVIINLLGNASKFTPEQGFISLDANLLEEKDGVCIIQIVVKDTGIGISEKQQEKLFRSFSQAEADTTRKYGGTGLGLAIARQIVEMMGGKIWVTSTLGEGSVFGFTVSIRRSANIIRDGEIQSNEDIRGNEAIQFDIAGLFAGKRILLVDDIEINREIVEAMLEQTLIKIDCAENGKEAVRMFGELPEEYDIIFMDLQMPEMDGYDATHQIRTLNTPKAATVPIIAMTANVFREDIERCLEAGMNGHIGKPIDYTEVINVLRLYLT